MNFIYVTAQRRNKSKEDHRSEIRNLYSCEKKSLKKECIEFVEKMGHGRYETFAQKVTH